MRLLRMILVLCLLLPVALPARASETAAEHAANVYAQQELDAAPRDGNIPDYSLPPDKLAKAVHLNTVRDTMHFADELWGIVSLLLLLGFGAVAWMRNVAVGRGTNRWLQGFVFILLFNIASTLLELPVDLYSQHLSLKYGLSVQSWGSWFSDQGKSFVLGLMVLDLVMMLLFWVIRKFPRRWWFAFWLCTIPLVLLAIFVSPYINLLYDKFEPLQKTNPELVAQLEKIVEKGHMNIPPERMFLMKASAKVTTLNAYVTGFGSSKRVVVWDTSLQKGTPDEVLFIFGHESGHYVLNHIVIGVVEAIAGLFVVLFLGYYFVQIMITRFGRRWGVASQNDWAAFAVLLLAFSVFGLISEPITNGLSRMDEHAADVYGQEAIHGLVADPQTTAKDAFDVLGETSLVDPNPNQFIEFWTYNHPAVGRRAAFAKAYDPWASGMEPKYFKK
ncbi:M48 family metalloprotease [Granulicella sp. 5B5]|uniref:M48 family metallopeptidase n=1 Tax=Granulicella sp. 5B5 TaxID=1617967 RepID=UPI0015F49E4B|nr:M48 family metallopeptidase [Granulicella sp. 5B5]QMV18531.1 M48 family metalloprotease [Granulicella sp. 5B5]